jgi:predicted helicase
MGEYEEFEHICFVDTLDHAAFHLKQMDLFAMSVENTQRIQNQNDRNISVIIGNPPYNAKQENFNQGNANRSYEEIDKRIKYTYVKEGTAQNQIVIYDMYTRFVRWASDRLSKNGIIAFVSNSSFIDALAYDGFRKVVADEFNEIWIVDAKGNARNSGERRRREGGNVFSDKIKVGIAVYFLVRNQESEGFKIFYNAIKDYAKAEEKQEYFRENTLDKLSFEHIIPDKKHNWLNQSDNDFNQLLPLIDKDVKSGKSEKALFKLFSSGLKTQRDEWVYDFSRDTLEAKMRFCVDVYQRTFEDENYQERNQIKWDRELTKYLFQRIPKVFNDANMLMSYYRPYTKQWLYFDKHFNGMTYQWYGIYKNEELENRYIIIPGLASPKNFYNLASSQIVDLNCLPAGCQCLPLYRYDKEGTRIDNITDWGLQQFQKHYNDKTITKLDIFHYTYAVLHYPEYRSKYELNLKREFPRLPFYDNFSQWVEWGSKLMELHINYETVAPYPLTRIDTNNNLKPKTKLKADREKNSINLDDVTFLQDIPKIAWEYKLGNRSALEWILDQYKEKKPKDQTIAERFNNYRFADYKETVIDLLQRVCTVSVETMKIIEAMRD